MKLRLSRILNGPQISDVLSGGTIGFDLSSFGLDGGSPGDISYFDLYVTIEASDTEKYLYDYLDFIKLNIEVTPTYTGDYDANADYLDILQLGDNGKGLSIGDMADAESYYRFPFHNGQKSITLTKTMAIFQDLSDLTNINIINSFGFNDTAMATSSGYTVNTVLSAFNFNLNGCILYNRTKNESAHIIEVISGTEALVDKVHGWDAGDIVYVKSLEEPHDGILAIKDENGIILGNCFKLRCKFELPTDYNRSGIKQFNLSITSGNEGE